MTNNERGERLQLAYEMAWFIRCNKRIAYLIALEVVCRCEIAPPQGQRPLSREQKFQRLVFEVSEYFEKAIEAINVGDADEVEEQVRRLALNMRRLEPTQQSIKIFVRKFHSLLAGLAAFSVFPAFADFLAVVSFMPYNLPSHMPAVALSGRGEHSSTPTKRALHSIKQSREGNSTLYAFCLIYEAALFDDAMLCFESDCSVSSATRESCRTRRCT